MSSGGGLSAVQWSRLGRVLLGLQQPGRWRLGVRSLHRKARGERHRLGFRPSLAQVEEACRYYGVPVR